MLFYFEGDAVLQNCHNTIPEKPIQVFFQDGNSIQEIPVVTSNVSQQQLSIGALETPPVTYNPSYPVPVEQNVLSTSSQICKQI